MVNSNSSYFTVGPVKVTASALVANISDSFGSSIPTKPLIGIAVTAIRTTITHARTRFKV